MPILLVSLIACASMLGFAAERTVPIEVASSGHIIIPVQFEDGSSAKFLLDTGSSNTVLDRDVARTQKLPTAAAGEMAGAGAGTIKAEITPKLTLLLPDRQPGVHYMFADEDITVIPLRDMLRSLDPQLVGILGGTFLQRNVISLDKKRGTMTITPAERFTPPEGQLGLPLQVIDGFPVLPGSFRMKRGGPQIRGNLLLDLGANHGLAVHYPTVQRHKLIDRDDPKQRDLPGGMGITGAAAPNRLAPCSEIRIGPLIRRNQEIELATGPGGAPQIPHLVGFIGTELFEGTLVLDYPHGKLWVE